ncbi:MULTISPECIES: 2-hydroxyacid dehydrogenase [Dyella]|uniref:D-glycerate dehydrogenase n=2 Tax=Dyella TaxID=231454 RepID=A0A4R0Z271_9GAMM|nr:MULTISPECIES: D-glycerate dehydrogenase [Dyella]TBR38880.1 D-glycerate dehydrogenase [Dyella terrae]TCI13528.1 D-glycerate dehydrogenase [Dyella soli]
MTGKLKIWVSRPLFPDVLARLAEHFDVDAEAIERKHSPEQVREKLLGVDAALLGLADRVNAQTLEGNERLRVVANLGVGYNNLDMPALTRGGVLACNTPDVLNESVADYAWALMLAAARRVGAAERWLRAGQWSGGMRFDDWLGVDVHGKTLGILGMGRIGQAIARRATGFDMPVIYHNRSRLPEAVERESRAVYVDKASLLRQSDHLILVLPYSRESHHAVGAAELGLMKRSAVLVNVARGGIVDDAALAVALRERRLAAAALDVFEGEPAVHPDLLDLDNVVLSPHIASASEDTRRAMAGLAADNVLAALGFGPRAGRPPTALNPEVMARWPAGGPR